MDFKPKIVEEKSRVLWGLQLDDVKFGNGPNVIPGLWNKFVPRMNLVEPYSIEPHGAYGAMSNYKMEEKTFSYLASIRTSEDAEISEELTRWNIPGGKFLRLQFELKDINAGIKFGYKWIQESEYEFNAEGIEYEWYPPGWNPETNSELFYYFPIRSA